MLREKRILGLIVLVGEVSLNGDVPDYEAIARKVGANIGYTSHAIGMDATNPKFCEVQVHITTQSANIAQGVNKDGLDQGAGDQGMMFGYACEETEAYEGLKGQILPTSSSLISKIITTLDCRKRARDIAVGKT